MKQSETETLIKCPCCGHQDYVTHLELKDYFLSNEVFSILKCKHCGLMRTNPQPIPELIGKYYSSVQYLSHATDNKGIDFFIYDYIRNKMHARKAALILKYKKGNRLLDIGCATGIFLNYCNKLAFEVEGIEPDEKARTYAREHYNLSVNDQDQLNLFREKSFDIITMWHVLEHVHDIDERMKIIKNLLTDNGVIFIALPNPASYDAQYYRQYWAAYDVPRHLYHFTQESFEVLAKRYKFEIIKKIPLLFDSYYISLLSERYMNGRGSYLKALLLGVKSNLYARKHNKNYSSLIYILKHSV